MLGRVEEYSLVAFGWEGQGKVGIVGWTSYREDKGEDKGEESCCFQEMEYQWKEEDNQLEVCRQVGSVYL